VRAMTIGALLALSLAVVGCGDDASEEGRDSIWTDEMVESVRNTCPMLLEGAGVQYAEDDGAVVLSFTAPGPAQLPELRRRERAMADQYESYPARGAVRWRPMRRHHRAMRGEVAPAPHRPMPAVYVRVEDIEDGARLVLTPEQGEDLDEVRRHAFAHHQRFHVGQCWMARDRA